MASRLNQIKSNVKGQFKGLWIVDERLEKIGEGTGIGLD